MKKTISFLLCIIVAVGLLSGTSIFASDEISVYLNGENLEFSIPPQIINNRTMVPMRVIFEAFNADIEWVRGAQQIIASTGGGWRYTFQIGSYQMEYFHPLGGVEHGIGATVVIEGMVELDAAPQIVNGHTFVPLRAISEVFGASVEWDGNTRTVTIVSKSGQTALPPQFNIIRYLSDFSFETALFNAMPTDENYMISPFSLRMALAMAANGASGTTQAEILAALNIDDLDAFNRVIAEFIASSNENEAVEFNIANSIWFNEDLFGYDDLDFSQDFKRVITDYFAGAAERVSAEDGADIINTWILEQTRGRISNVIADDTFDEDSETLAVLVNAIYFNGSWASSFDPEQTRDGTFTDRNGISSIIPFMEQTRWFSFYENNYFQMLAKPYYDENIRMYFVLPKVDRRLSFSMFEDAIDSMEWHDVRFRLPRFETEFLHDNLVEILQEMGIEKAFEREHFDFWDMIYPTQISGELIYLWIDDVFQKTFISVDEAGTEAAAVTVVEMAAGITSVPPPPIPFYCDRPFIYFIRNDTTGDILFMGEFAFVE